MKNVNALSHYAPSSKARPFIERAFGGSTKPTS
jgi:hypothetical protein